MKEESSSMGDVCMTVVGVLTEELSGSGLDKGQGALLIKSRRGFDFTKSSASQEIRPKRKRREKVALLFKFVLKSLSILSFLIFFILILLVLHLKDEKNCRKLTFSIFFFVFFHFFHLIVVISSPTPFQDRRQGRQLTPLTPLPVHLCSLHDVHVPMWRCVKHIVPVNMTFLLFYILSYTFQYDTMVFTLGENRLLLMVVIDGAKIVT